MLKLNVTKHNNVFNIKSKFSLSHLDVHVLNLNCQIIFYHFTGQSWWKRLEDNSRDVMEVLETKTTDQPENVEEFIEADFKRYI